MPHIVPTKGTEAERAANYAAMMTGEIHTTTDQERLFVSNRVMNPVFIGSVDDQTAMIASNTLTRGCWPGDTVFRQDKGCLFVCIANNGEDPADWLAIGTQRQAAIVDTDQSDLPADNAIGSLTISAGYVQAEAESLRDATEDVRDTVKKLADKVDELLAALRATGGAGILSD